MMGLDKILLAVGRSDPCFFLEYFLGLHLNPFNKRALLSFLQGSKEILWVTSNQVGKTVTLAGAHVWFDFYKIGFSGDPQMIEDARYESLNLSPVSRQATECFRYAEEILHSQFSWEEGGARYVNKCRIGWFWEGKNENLGRVNFANNSFFWCLSTAADQASGIAGKQFGFISYDECVQSHHLEDELGARIYSRTAKYSGWVVLVATPDDLAKSQQYWYHLYTEAVRAQKGEGDSPWLLITGVYDENIFIAKEIREEFKKRLKRTAPARYNQVIKGMFLDAANRMFPLRVVEGMWNGKLKTTPYNPNMVFAGGKNREPEYVEIIDWGVADAGDETVIFIADVTDIANIELIYAWAKQGGDPVELMAMAGFLSMEYGDCPMVMDVSEMGGTIFKKMMKKFKPITFGQGNKADALTYLLLRLRANVRKKLTKDGEDDTEKLKSYYLPKLAKQLSTYKLDDKKLKQDWVMALAMLAWYVEKYKKRSKMKSFSLTNFYKN